MEWAEDVIHTAGTQLWLSTRFLGRTKTTSPQALSLSALVYQASRNQARLCYSRRKKKGKFETAFQQSSDPLVDHRR